MTSRGSFIHPMFHFWSKPRPPWSVPWDTLGHEVDSSATTMAPGTSWWTASLMARISATASRFSRPPSGLGVPLPSGRE